MPMKRKGVDMKKVDIEIENNQKRGIFSYLVYIL